MPAKKKRERLLLEELRSVYSGFPAGRIEEFEGPDFLVYTEGGEIVGVELVDYVRGQSEKGSANRRDEQLRQRVVGEAKARLEEEILVALEVHFIWHPHRCLDRNSVTSLAVQVAEVVKRNIPLNVLGTATVHADQFAELSRKHLHSLHLVRLRDTSLTLWSSVEGGWTEVSTGEIQSLVASKNERVGSYRQNCNKIWLLIVADGRHISSCVDLHTDVYAYPFETGFDEVIFWDRLRRSSVALHIERSA